MKNKSLASLQELKNIIGLKIVKCYRKFNTYDVSHIPVNLRNLEQDGLIFLILEDNSIIGFYPNTESFSIDYNFIEDLEINQLIDISEDLFFKNIIGFNIVNLTNLYEFLEKPYGLEFVFENNSRMNIIYESESDYEFDSLIIR